MIRPRPERRVPSLPSPGLLHTHCKRMLVPRGAPNHSPQRGIPTRRRGNPRKATKDVWALSYNAPNLILAATDAGARPQTTEELLVSLCSTPPEEHNQGTIKLNILEDWLSPLPLPEKTRRKRPTDVSKDPKYTRGDLAATVGDVECTTVPNRIPHQALPTEVIQFLFEANQS